MTVSISATKFWGSLFCGKRSLEHAGCTECEGGGEQQMEQSTGMKQPMPGRGKADLNISQAHFPPLPSTLRLTSFLRDAS